MVFSVKINKILEMRYNEGVLRHLKDTSSVGAKLIYKDNLYINFASNDYLGIASSQELKNGAIDFINRYGIGSGSSRLIASENAIYEALESKIAKFKGTENALILNNGFSGNLGAIEAFGKLGHLFVDKLCHNSIINGAKLSKYTRFKHNNFIDLDLKIRQYDNTHPIIVCESIYSMDGDLCDLDAIYQLKSKYNSLLYIDEAHSSGVYGHSGKGLLTNCDVDTIIFGTFSKAFGCFGAYIACSNQIKQYLINFCSSLIYSTSLPMPVLGSINAALDFVPNLNKARVHLLELAKYTRYKIRELGFDIGNSQSHIIPIIDRDVNKIKSLHQALLQNSIFAPLIMPPTVPYARIRISLISSLTFEDVDKLIAVLQKFVVNDDKKIF